MAQVKSTGSNGSGNADGRSKSGSGNKSGGAASTPQLMLIELKQRILCALNKLADRDTQHIAVEDLERIAETLTSEGISLCLSCLYDTDSQQKVTVRKECVKMFGTLATLHDDLLAPHLSKIVINIVKRLRDPDSSIRDACVDTMGTLAAKVSAGSGGGESTAVTAFSGALGVFAKPLFDVLNEQSRSVQAGAALCLAGVIDNLKDPPTASLQRLCPRIIKLLNSPTFTAKAALLSVIASIVQAGGATSYQCLAMVIACVQECLKSNDWATRKAAAETLACMASTVGLSLGTFKSPVLEALEACRFDKVKPVRDMVVQTVQVWKRIPSSDSEQDKISSGKENDRVEMPDFQPKKKKVEGGKDSATSQKLSAYNNSDCESQDGGCFGFGHSRSAANKIHGDTLKKHAPLTDKRSNPPFFNKVEKKEPTNWQIDIALPRALTDGMQSAPNLDASKQLMTERKIYQEHCSVRRISDQDLTESYGRRPGDSSVTASTPLSLPNSQVFEESVGTSSTKSQTMTTKHSSCIDLASQIEEAEIGSWSIGAGVTSSSSSSVNDSHAINSESGTSFVQQQLFHIETQQANILNLLQELMKKSEESLSKLEARIAGVESTVGNLVTDLTNVNSARCVKLQTATDLSNPKIWKKSETSGFTQDRPRSSESLISARGGRLSPRLMTGAPGLNDNRFGTGLSPRVSNLYSEAQANSWRAHVDVSSDNLQRRSRTEVEGIPFVNKNVQDWGPASRLGEGPSARSIWQASKDEATLAAIRVAGEDGRTKLPDSLNVAGVPALLTAEVKPELSVHKIGGQGKGPFWSLWARAAEFLRSGDVDSAYVEVLCAGDELLLVRLMSRTGPVLEQLSNGTIQELLRTVVQLMLQQSFLDVIIPWMQQISDLVASNGADCLGLSFDPKRNIVAALEEASTSSFSEKWISTTVHELALQLASAWGLVHAR